MKKTGEMREQKLYYHNMPLSVMCSCFGITVQPVLESLGRRHLIIPKLRYIFSHKGGFFGGLSFCLFKEIYSGSLPIGFS